MKIRSCFLCGQGGLKVKKRVRFGVLGDDGKRRVVWLCGICFQGHDVIEEINEKLESLVPADRITKGQLWP